MTNHCPPTKPSQRWIILVAYACLLVVGTGCVTHRNANRPEGQPVEKVSNGSLRIRSAVAEKDGDKMLIRGSVVSAVGYEPTIYSHLDLLEIDAGGEVLAGHSFGYYPYPIRQSRRGIRSHSHFATTVALLGKEGSTLRLEHHQGLLAACNYRSTETGSANHHR